MNQNMPERPGVHEDAPPDPKLAAWWRSLTTKAKKALARRRERTEAKKVARAAPPWPVTSGYQCPKCWAWHPTVAERVACRVGHPVPRRFDCEECGPGVKADEDGCCVTCGRDCNPNAPKGEA